MPKATARPANKLAAARAAKKKAAAAKAKAKDKQPAPEVTEIPEWQGEEVFELEVPSLATVEVETKTGKIVERPVKLARKDFPKNREGKLAFADYQIAMWVNRKADWEKRTDPNAKKVRQVERLRAQLEKLEAQLAKENGDADDSAEE